LRRYGSRYRISNEELHSIWDKDLYSISNEDII